MGPGLFAEASPCCPSPIIGQFVVIAYVVGGGLVYAAMLFAVFRRILGRHDRPPADR